VSLFGRSAPGSIPWLLGHELRLAWHGAALNKGGKRRPGNVTMAIWATALVALHAFAFFTLRALYGDGVNDAVLAIPITILVVTCATFMLSSALRSCVLALFERGDLDLLLSSPLPSRSIFAVRLLGIAATTALPYLFLAGPFANAGLVLGHPGWLGLYVVVGASAMLMACAGMLLTLALVRVLGARRTRVVAQVVAAVAGALLFLLSQAYNFMSHDTDARPRFPDVLANERLFALDSALWLPGRAVLGAPLPLLGAALLASLAFALTVGRTHRFFAHGLQQAAGAGRVSARPAGALRFRFRRSLFDTIVAKEWRLIVRDPNLIAQVLLQLIYIVPMLIPVLRGGGGAGPALGAGLTLLCSSLAGRLAWIVISAEDAPDLLLSAPASRRTVQLAKLAAATMPALLLVALPLLWLIVRTPLTGLLFAFTICASVLCAGLIVLWTGRPALRSDFKARGKENFACTMLELVSSLCWAGLGWLLVSLATTGAGWMAVAAAAALVGALVVLLIARVIRRHPV
jgi:ABC-2 type transport system permease protein